MDFGQAFGCESPRIIGLSLARDSKSKIEAPRLALTWVFLNTFYMGTLKLFLCFIVGLNTSSAFAADWRSLSCDFGFYGALFATLEFQFRDGGIVSDAARITHYGRVTFESLTPEPLEDGILVHATVSKESEENWLDLLVRTDYSALLTNPHAPAAVQTMAGSCIEIGR